MNQNTTVGEIVAQALLGDKTETPSSIAPGVGASVLIRTVTNYHTGRIIAIDDRWIVLEDAAWVGNTGRFSTALNSGELTEVEPFVNNAWVAVGAVVDMTIWTHDLPRSVK